MLKRLIGVCAVLAVAAAVTFAADKPKRKKEQPIGGLVIEEFNKPTESPKYAETKFVITKPVGTWVRVVRVRDATVRVLLKVGEDRLHLMLETALGEDTGRAECDADYAINKESCLFGVFDTLSTDQSIDGNEDDYLKLSGQPFSVRFRVDGDTLSLKEFKGGSADVCDQLLVAICGKYTAVDPAKPLPTLKAFKGNGGINSDPLLRQERLLNQSETHGPPGVGVPPPLPLPKAPPSHLTPQRIHGGILKAETPKETGIVPVNAELPLPVCDPPSDAEVMVAFNAKRAKQVGEDFALFQEDIVIVKNLVKDRIDAPRYYPFVGMAQNHCCQWECGVYFNDTSGGGRKPRVEVIRLDTQKFRMVESQGDVSVPQRMSEK